MTEELIVDMLKIPRDRVAVLIGKKGKTKRKLEKDFKIKLEINSETGEVNLSRKPEHSEQALQARQIIKAIGGGISPQKAYKLQSPNYYLEQVSLVETVGDSEKELRRIKSRIIGREGKVREHIANKTETEIIIYGDLITFLGEIQDIDAAKRAVFKLIDGAQISTVMKFVDKYNTMKANM